MDLSEHEKLKAIKPLSQAIGNFIEWLGENGMAVTIAQVLERARA